MKEKLITVKRENDVKKLNNENTVFIADFTRINRSSILPSEFENNFNLHIFLCTPQIGIIGDRAFANNTKLTNFGGKPKIIGDEAFSFCSNLRSFEFNNVISIGSGAFQYTGIKEFNAPDTLTTLKDNTFNGCYKLEDVNLGHIQSIGHHCFSCSSISSIILNKELEKIGNQAFEACLFLKHIICLSEEPPRLCESSLSGVNLEKIWLVNEKALKNYSSAKYWSEYKDIMCLINWDDIKKYLDFLKEERSKVKSF